MMKKAISIMLVMMMICSGAFAGGYEYTRKEFMEMVQEQTLGVIKTLVDFYDTNKEDFTDDLIFAAYGYFKMIMGVNSVLAAERVIELEEARLTTGAGSATDATEKMTMQMEWALNLIEEDINAKYKAWVDGKISGDEAAETFIKQLRSIYDTYAEK